MTADEDRSPAAVLFCCSENSLRSPMAAALMRHLFGRTIFSDSAGVRAKPVDPFAITVMDEIGIDITKHKPKTFEDLEDSSFDLIVSLSPEAQHKAVDMTRTMACDVEYWPTMDPSTLEGSRATVLDAYRAVRDQLMRRIKQRFAKQPAPSV